MTTSDYLGLSHAHLAALLGPVSPSDTRTGDAAEQGSGLDGDATETRFAWAALSTVVEPGDTDARLLTDALGATLTLRFIVDGASSATIVDRIRDRDASAADAIGPRLTAALERWKPRLTLAASTRALSSAANLRATLLTPADHNWPASLAALGAGAPLALWVRGDPARLSDLNRSVALVGARAATGYGEHVAMDSAAGLSDRGFAIVSGGAYGIDGAAHRAALASDQTTVAFLAGGVDRLYPTGHSRLLQRIADRGLLIGELPCGSPPTRWRFLQRNRLIAAVATATVVVEAGHRSGSLNTAAHAATMGRPLGAVPGPITSPASSGCHRLIREFDAACVTSADEMAELAGDSLSGSGESPHRTDGSDRSTQAAAHRSERSARAGAPNGSRSRAGVAEIDGVETRLRDALSARRPRSVTDIASRSGLAPTDVTAALGRLEVEGQVKEGAGGWLRT